ncbi:MAG: flippase-like domain-containing protein [Dysgonamonadaceae bacterium]|nr:flippase-like domain-containing protein [Dysgonamonadaceae bacterium]
MANPLSKLLKIFIPLVLGIVILYFLYRKTNFHELWQYIKEANWWILSFSLIFGLMGNVFRGFRWDLLIKPLGYQPKTSHIVYAVLGSYAVNFALPRAGELWRCGMVSKTEKVPFPKLIGTILIDRLFDVAMVGLFVLAAFVCNVKIFYKNRDLFDLPDWLTSPGLYIGLAVIAVTCIVLLVLFKNNPLVRKIRDFFIAMGQDMLQVWKMREKTRFILYSFGIWISYFLYFYITFYAFDFTAQLGIAAGLFVFAISSISMSIPSNGGLGPWQATVVFGLCAYMVNIEQAKAFATAVFAFQSIWVVICGLFGMVMLSVGKENSRTIKVVN